MTQMQKRIQLVKQIQTHILRIMVQTFQPSVENSFFIKKWPTRIRFVYFLFLFKRHMSSGAGALV